MNGYLLKFVICILAISLSVHVKAQDPISHNRNIQVRTVPDSVVEKMKRDKDFRYANDSSYWIEKEFTEARDRNAFERIVNLISKSTFLKLIVYFLIAAGIIYLLYQVMIVNNFFIHSRSKRRNAKGQGDQPEEVAEDIDERIRSAIQNKDYRHAIRYMYLKTLNILNANKLITLHAKSTNRDYIRQMNRHSQAGQFTQLTHIYEYVWYGEFDPSETQFEIIQTNFNQFNPGR